MWPPNPQVSLPASRILLDNLEFQSHHLSMCDNGPKSLYHPISFKTANTSWGGLCDPHLPVEETEIQWDEEALKVTGLRLGLSQSQSPARSTHCISIAYVAFIEHLLCAKCFTGLKCHGNSVRKVSWPPHYSGGDWGCLWRRPSAWLVDGGVRIHIRVETWISSGAELLPVLLTTISPRYIIFLQQNPWNGWNWH